MTMLLAIIADDLTGALDSSTPFVLAGLSVEVAVDLAGLDAAIVSGADVVAVNTASRALPPDRAADRAELAARRLMQAAPAIVFKKIDSRLKGNIGAETTRIAEITGRNTVLVAPAVPDQQRLTRNGHVEGRGVDTPRPIAPLFAKPVHIADALRQDDLDRLAAKTDWSTHLAVGARGLGLGLARHLSAATGGAPFAPRLRTLFAFGSRDPITEQQMDCLLAERAVGTTIDALNGLLVGTPLHLPALLRCTGPAGSDANAVAGRFGDGVARCVLETAPDVLIMGGGDTALAILSRLGVSTVTPRGEIAPGMPWFEIALAEGRAMVCAVKSGGFGAPDSLLQLTTRRAASDVGDLNQENHRAQR